MGRWGQDLPYTFLSFAHCEAVLGGGGEVREHSIQKRSKLRGHLDAECLMCMHLH